MFTEKKTEECVCPRCKQDHSVVDDWDFDGNSMMRKMYCEDCGYVWREYFVIVYDGYTDDTGEYDSNGVMLESYTNEEDH